MKNSCKKCKHLKYNYEYKKEICWTEKTRSWVGEKVGDNVEAKNFDGRCNDFLAHWMARCFCYHDWIYFDTQGNMPQKKCQKCGLQKIDYMAWFSGVCRKKRGV